MWSDVQNAARKHDDRKDKKHFLSKVNTIKNNPNKSLNTTFAHAHVQIATSRGTINTTDICASTL